jgi:hypothetical protein
MDPNWDSHISTGTGYPKRPTGKTAESNIVPLNSEVWFAQTGILNITPCLWMTLKNLFKGDVPHVDGDVGLDKLSFRILSLTTPD